MASNEILNLAVVVGQHDNGHVEPGVLNLAGKLGGIHVPHFEVRDNQVEAELGACQRQRLCAARNVGYPRYLLKIEFERLTNQQLVEPAVFAKDERIVEAGDQENVLHPEGHQVLEALEESLRIDDGVGCVPHAHGQVLACNETREVDIGQPASYSPPGHKETQTSPWSSIAFATFRNPAMFAPFTRLPGVP